MLLRKSFVLITFLLISCQILLAQKMTDYKNNWIKVTAFEKKGLTASALKEVNSIFTLAVKDGNEVQQIKAAMYQMNYRNIIEEDNQEKNIFYLDTLIKTASGYAKNILLSMQAELYQNYRNNNRYKLYGRTALTEEKSSDISTWSVERLNGQIAKLYHSSLVNPTILKSTSINKLKAILEKSKNTDSLRPTLYDFLAHRALEYLMDEENDVTEPSYKFILNDEKLFSTATDFVTVNFKTKDSSSLYHAAVTLLQEIITFHLNDTDHAALIDADLTRLAFINNHGVFTNKDSLYEKALLNIETVYKASQSAARAGYLRAYLYKQQGENYQPNIKTTYQFHIQKAKLLCDSIMAAYPTSEGALLCKNMLIDITQPLIKLETEKINLPDHAFRSLLTYKNTDKIYLRIIKTNKEEIDRLENDDNEIYWQTMVNKNAVKSWSVALPDLKDHQEHSTEINSEALPAGSYFIIASINPDFRLTKNFLARQLIYSSNISYINNNQDDVYLLNRDNGQPLANAELQLWQRIYNYTTRKYETVKAEKYQSDKNGHVKIKYGNKRDRNYYYQVKFKAEELFTNDNFYSYQYNGYENKNTRKSFLFTDRSIYRPGQTVFFKGIIVGSDATGKKNSALANIKSTITLFDANHQKAAVLNLVTNEYGSYNGSFTLPMGGMNGQFYITDSANQGSVYFKVEEYKRPKFFVEVKKPEGVYRVNDSIEVKGTAKAYAGNNIDAAEVTYRVVRKVQYPVWWGWGGFGKRFPPYGESEEMEIKNGKTKTNSNGEFSIIFKSIPDETVDKKDQPVFYYEVSADITDINGETRSGQTTVAVSYQALQLNIIAAGKLPADSLKTVKISSANTNGLFEKTTVHLTIEKLQSPDRIFRERFWEAPDQFVIKPDDYKRIFPYDAYSDENDIAKWPVQMKIAEVTDSTAENSSINFPTMKAAAGWYKVTATATDKFGEKVSSVKYLQLTNTQQTSNENAVMVEVNDFDAAPGEKISYTIATGFNEIWLIHSLDKMDDQHLTNFTTIKNSRALTNDITIGENDRGGMNMSYAFVKNNRLYTGNQYFSIPWKNKDLEINYETFRDKILPGSEEKWKIKISGNKSEKVAAEALISMYDASLDQFNPHNWNSLKSLWPVLMRSTTWNAKGFEAVQSQEKDVFKKDYVSIPDKYYAELLNNGWNSRGYGRGGYTFMANASPRADDQSMMREKAATDGLVTEIKQVKFTASKIVKDEEVSAHAEMPADSKIDASLQNSNIQTRKNFNETAFFFPALTTDDKGTIEFSFTIPEALTTWKMMTLAHTKELASGYAEKNTITQKPMMVQPNAPRFLREGDQMEFSTKIVNLSDSEITGQAQLELLDAATNKPVDGWFKNIFPVQYFTVAAKQSTAVKFPIEIPFTFNSALTWRIKAITNDKVFSDGEEAAIPILSNRILVTESMPLNMRNTSSKNFKFEKLLTENNSGTLTNHALTVEYTSNPVWYAIQALPYLIEFPYDCAEQSFNRYYANTLAAYVSSSTPKIKAVFEKWLAPTSASNNGDSQALLSNLQKNEELKSALLQETPWVLEAKNEAEQKKNIAILFDLVRLAKEKENTLNKLKEMQSSNGGFAWFKDGPDDRYITQYIISGIGHLNKLNAFSTDDYNKLKPILDKALLYLDARLKEEYDNLKKHKVNLKNNNLSYTAIQYLYMRSFFKENKIAGNAQEAYKYFLTQSQQYWLGNSKYMQAMIALALFRTGDEKIPKAIISSLKENAIYKEEMGMYFKEFTNGGYYWYQSPIESQAMIIEAFTDIDKNSTTIDDLKTWLLKQKQTQNWKTTKATAEACYALLLNGSSWLMEEKEVQINAGNLLIKNTDQLQQSGTGYFKKTIPGDQVQQGMGNITVNIKTTDQKPTTSTSWGAVYWQYFEDLDKITTAETPLKLVKKLFIEVNSDKGPVLKPLNNGDALAVGDKIKVRIELRSDRDMEYLHMKDMRAACMEPINVISQYKWQGGLGYYETTKDASTNFFFSWLPRGTYVFEYGMFVTHGGNYSNGVTNIQCMYAPEFSSHSEGIRVNVE